MNTGKRQKYEAVKVPMSAIIEELGDPSTWDEEDAEYELAVRQKGLGSELPMAAATRKPSARNESRIETTTKRGGDRVAIKGETGRVVERQRDVASSKTQKSGASRVSQKAGASSSRRPARKKG